MKVYGIGITVSEWVFITKSLIFGGSGPSVELKHILCKEFKVLKLGWGLKRGAEKVLDLRYCKVRLDYFNWCCWVGDSRSSEVLRDARQKFNNPWSLMCFVSSYSMISDFSCKSWTLIH